MIHIYEQICQGENLRGNLRTLYDGLKDEEKKRKFAYRLGGDFHVFTSLLSSDDPKVRRLAALLLGQFETEDVLPELMRAWKREKTLFVRYAYPEAMKNLDVTPYLEDLRREEERLYSITADENAGPHIRLELTALHELLLPYEVSKHELNTSVPADNVILTCLSGCGELTAQQIRTGHVEVKGASVHVKDGSWDELLKIRTWSALLIPLSVCSKKLLSGDALTIGRLLGEMRIDQYLDSICTGKGRWRYRLEIKPAPDDGKMIHSICSEIDRLSGGRFVNDAGNYEVMIRLLKRRDGAYAGFIRLMVLPDHRFDYRREYIPDSLTGVAAACVAAIGAKYSSRKSANVLDPFCGVGTLLLERRYLSSGAASDEEEASSSLSLYGTDISEDAIQKGRLNAQRARMPLHLINRNFFDFKHEYRFDEVITDLPRTRRDGQIQNAEICRKFFAVLPEHLKPGAVITVYTMDEKDTLCCAGNVGCYEKKACVRLNEKSGAAVLVFRYVPDL